MPHIRTDFGSKFENDLNTATNRADDIQTGQPVLNKTATGITDLTDEVDSAGAPASAGARLVGAQAKVVLLDEPMAHSDTSAMIEVTEVTFGSGASMDDAARGDVFLFNSHDMQAAEPSTGLVDAGPPAPALVPAPIPYPADVEEPAPDFGASLHEFLFG